MSVSNLLLFHNFCFATTCVLSKFEIYHNLSIVTIYLYHCYYPLTLTDLMSPVFRICNLRVGMSVCVSVFTPLSTLCPPSFVDTFCDHFLRTYFWIILVDTFCGQFLWTLLVYIFYEHFLWTLFLWSLIVTLFVDTFLWTLFCGHFFVDLFLELFLLKLFCGNFLRTLFCGHFFVDTFG